MADFQVVMETSQQEKPNMLLVETSLGQDLKFSVKIGNKACSTKSNNNKCLLCLKKGGGKENSRHVGKLSSPYLHLFASCMKQL